MRNKTYWIIAVTGAIAGIVMNLEMLVLEGYETVEMQYMNAVFPFNLFLQYKQYFVSFKLILASLVFICMTVNVMKEYQIPYVLLRVKDRFRWEMGLTFELVKKAFCFYCGFTLMIFIISAVTCGGQITFLAWRTWLLSLAALVYLGTILGSIVNILASLVKFKSAVIITYILFLAAAFLTMQYADWFTSSKALLYLNPITAVSIAEEESAGMTMLTLCGMGAVTYVCRGVVAYSYTRWEKYVQIEN